MRVVDEVGEEVEKKENRKICCFMSGNLITVDKMRRILSCPSSSSFSAVDTMTTVIHQAYLNSGHCLGDES